MKPPAQVPDVHVGEVTVNWYDGAPREGSARSLAEGLQTICRHKAAQGFRMTSWQMARVLVPMSGPTGVQVGINETIVAVFERVPGAIDTTVSTGGEVPS